MSQTSITITDGVTTHSEVLNIINSNSSDAESRIHELELVSGQGGGGDANSGDNISIFVNDSGYVNSLELDSVADENVAIYDPSEFLEMLLISITSITFQIILLQHSKTFLLFPLI